jgi:chromate transport protein ChrA
VVSKSGIYGDLGVLGLIAIVLLWWIPWSVARRSPEGLGAQAVILFTLLLGLFFNWMEEPILVIVAAVLIGAETAPLVGMESEVASRDVSSRAVTAS